MTTLDEVLLAIGRIEGKSYMLHEPAGSFPKNSLLNIQKCCG